ncbi:GD16526 [Drosophila simulans]|uniref:GD16526 n=1 Tax=Drosophila simulans TaxID=7240 RepID=B4R7H6_DROSI|nr:GD16526 [Drosophila simulans]
MASSGGACSHFAFVAWAVFALLLTHGGDNVVDARRNQGNQRKTSSSSSSSNYGHVTQPSYNTNGHAARNSHADVAKLSYPNYTRSRIDNGRGIIRSQLALSRVWNNLSNLVQSSGKAREKGTL